MKKLKITRWQSSNDAVDIFTFNNKKEIKINWLSVKSIMKVPKKYMRIINQWLKDAIEFVNSPAYMDNLMKSFGYK